MSTVTSFLLVVILSLTQFHVEGGNDKKPIGLGSVKPPDEKIRLLVEMVEPEIREKMCVLTPQQCALVPDTPVNVEGYRKQVVDGTNYFAAVSWKYKFYHVRIYEQTWLDSVELVDVIGPKGKKEEIRYF